MFSLDDTIVAIASASGGAGRGIVRLSGPDVVSIASRCFSSANRSVELGKISIPTAVDGQIFVAAQAATDCAAPANSLPVTLFLWPTGRSYTRQPVVEFHTIGSPPLLDWLLQRMCASGARLAQPGEFTLRAFLAGRIDLTQAEAVLGVIDAIDRRQLDAGLAQLAGGLSEPLQKLRDDLLNLLADLESGLDFAEEDIHLIERHELDERLASAASQLESLWNQLGQRVDANQSLRVALIGAPNVGKSSLFNALAQADSALVSPTAGTTRDYLSANIVCDGMEIELIDTAGVDMDPIPSPLGAAARQAATLQHLRADLRVLCLDTTRSISDWEQQTLRQLNLLVAWTKCDLAGQSEDGIITRSRTGYGLSQLRAAIAGALLAKPAESNVVAATAARTRESIRLAIDAIAEARQLAETAGEELIAVPVRAVLEELGKICGTVYTADLLDRIFSRFCLGK
ncbi:MAG: 50S ribosome-binding GTPase [Pirellulales bacterium]|nr:50S ribosome-binding GTPase [Pirellulales bacterium]